MAECRACLAKNVRMHLITDTRYREMFEKLSGNKLSTEDGRPETICYICNSLLQRFWRFFEMSLKTEKMLTTRLLFGIEMQDTIDAPMYKLSTTTVKTVSFLDDGIETTPEVTVTVKEELDDVDEWERFKEEFMDSPTEDIENDDYEANENFQTNTEMEDENKEREKLPDFLENAKKLEIKNELLDFIKTETIENTDENLSQNNTQLTMTVENDENPIKEVKFPFKADTRYMNKSKLESYYYCDSCDYRCRQPKTLRRHNKHHDPNNKFACTFCLYRFADETKLTRHRKYCTVCNICGKKFHNLNGLRIHVRLHTGEQPFSCDLCGRGFNQKTNLQTHLRVHAREKQYPCEICHKIFPFSSYLKRHMLIHSENNIDGESMHRIQNCHKLFSRKKKVMSACTFCGKILRKDSMAMHMRLHTGEQPFSCEKCNRYFNQKCNLLTHVERCHPGDDLFACKVCFKTFAMNSELRKHMVTHGMKVEIKKELIAQTEKTIKNFISRYEKEVEQRMEALTEADKKMELIFNLGLKPRVKSPEPNGMIAIPNINEGDSNTRKRKGSKSEPGIKKTKRKKAPEITVLRDSIGGMIRGIKIKGFPLNPTIEEHISSTEKIIKQESNAVNDYQENVLANLENEPCTYMCQGLQNSHSKALEASNDFKKDSNSLTQEDSPEFSSVFVSANRNFNEGSSEDTQNIKEVEIKREFILENNNLTENEVLLETVDKEMTKPKENWNLTDELINENIVAEVVPIKNELGDFVYCNEINSDDIEYFDDGIEIVEVEISDSEDYSNFIEKNAENVKIVYSNEDSEVTQTDREKEKTIGEKDLPMVFLNVELEGSNLNRNALDGSKHDETIDTNFNKNALAGTEKEKTIRKEDLATVEPEDSNLSQNALADAGKEKAIGEEDLVTVELEGSNLIKNTFAGTEEERTTDQEVLATVELESSTQVLPSGVDDHGNKETQRHSMSDTGVEVSVLDPDDVDESNIDSEQENIEEEYLDLSDDELIGIGDDSLDDEKPTDAIKDLIDVENKRNATDDPKTLFPCNKPRIKLRIDLFDCHREKNLNIEGNIEPNNRISNINADIMLTDEANIDLTTNDEDIEIVEEENHSDDFIDTEYLDVDSNDYHFEADTDDSKLDNISTSEDHSDDIADAELTSDSNYENPILAKDFDVFQQKHLISVHRKMNNLITPYPCELCITKVFSY